MNQEEFEYMVSIAPLLNTSARLRIARIAVTTSSARHDLSLRITGWNQGWLTFRAVGGDVSLAFNNADAGTVDRTTTSSGATECVTIPDGDTVEWKMVDDFKWLIVQGSASCVLEVAKSSRRQGQTASEI